MSRTPARRRWIADRPIGVKIGIVVGALAVVATGTSTLAVTHLEALAADQRTIYEENLEPLTALAGIQRANAGYRQRMLEYAVADQPRRIEMLPEFDEKLADQQAALDDYAPFVVDSAAMAAFDAAVEGMIASTETQLVPAADAGDLVTFNQVFQTVSRPTIGDAAQALEDEAAAQSAQADQRNRESAAEADSARTLIIASLVAGLLVTVGLAFWIIRRMLATVRSVQASVQAMAEGDLTVAPDVRDRDEIGEMASALIAAQGALREVMAGVVGAADAVAASSEELSASSAQISASAEETSAQSGVVSGAAEEVSRSVQTVAAGAEQMGASIREIASNAAEASQVAARAVTAAETTSA
ncbi:MCP four helix bundle domain-containing protein, partial [Blastococcus xanthinilyticus]